MATNVFATDYSIDCPSGTASGTSCYQYTCGSNCTATLIGGAMTISGSGAMTNYSSSSMPWKEQRESITSVTIDSGITSLGNNAFYGASNMTTVSVPNTVTNLGHYTFMNATSLSSINIPSSVTSIGNGPFAYTTSLRNLDLPDTITSIGSAAFWGAGLTNINIPDAVQTIGSYAIYNMQNLKEVNFGENSQLTNIDRQGFANNPLLKTIQLPDTVQSIGYVAFGGTGISDLIIPESVETIGTPGIGAGLAGVNNIYCSAAQINGGICDSSKIRSYYYDAEDGIDRYPEEGVQVYRYEQVGDHYNIYDMEGNKVAAYRNLLDFGTNNVFKRTSYSPAEAAQHVNHTNNNKVIFTFK